MSLRIRHQLLGGHVEHGETVLIDGAQLLFQPLFHDLGQGIAVFLLGPLPGDGIQLFLGAIDKGREIPHGNRADIIDHIRDLTGVCDHYLKGLFFT